MPKLSSSISIDLEQIPAGDRTIHVSQVLLFPAVSQLSNTLGPHCISDGYHMFVLRLSALW